MLNVTSEIGRLRRVLLHEPGPEVDRMVPAMMEELLFDDILFGEGAREEHGRLRRVLQLLGIEPVEALTLLGRTVADPQARDWVLDVLREDLRRGVLEELRALPPDELASALVAGVRTDRAPNAVEVDQLYEVPPLPNWCFQRDPQIVLGGGVILSAMASPARHREGLLARAIFRFHPTLCGTPVLYDPFDPGPAAHPFARVHPPRIEGGDVLVLSPEVVAVGRSERTNRTAILGLARALARRDDGPRWLVAADLPRRRAYMHLDTVLTPADRDACLVYPPVVLPGSAEQASVFEIDLHDRDLTVRPGTDLLSSLAARGVDLEPIPCGGPDPVTQQREQWTDGANALALAPGVIALYDRNLATAEELSRRGFRVVDAEDLLLGREEVDLDAGRRVCIRLASHELSRARGGPHCLAHPLERDPLPV